MLRSFFLICIISIGSLLELNANVWLPDIFSEGMVLQQNTKIKVWGNAAPRERVAVTLRGRSAITRADRAGKWEVFLEPLSAGGPFTMNVLGRNLITINNVWIGDVLVLSGETLKLKTLENTSNLNTQNSSYTAFFQLPARAAIRPSNRDSKEISWKENIQDTLLMQAAAMMETDVPKGFIISQFDQAKLAAWIHPDSLREHPTYKDALASLDTQYASANSFFTNKGRKPADYPGVIYNGMLAPIAGYSAKGLLFHLNNLDAKYAFYTKELHQLLLQTLRSGRNAKLLPVLFFNNLLEDAAELQEIRNVLLESEKVGFFNQTNTESISVESLTETLQCLVSDKIELFRPPVFEKYSVNGKKLIIQFDNNAPLRFRNKYGYGKGFTLAGKNRKFYPAQAFVVNDSSIILSSDSVENPVTARYGFDYLNEGNLSDENNFTLALPFKTDYWNYTSDTSSFKSTWLEANLIDTNNMLTKYYENLPVVPFDSSKLNKPTLKLRQYRPKEEAILKLEEILSLDNLKQRNLAIPVHIKSLERNDSLTIESLIINTEEDIYLDATFIFETDKANQKVLIVDQLNSYLTDTLLATGHAILVFNPRKIGALDSLKTKALLRQSILKNKYLVNRKIYDYQRAIDFLQTRHHQIDTSQIHLAQLDTTSKNRIDMLLTTALEERVQSVFLQRHTLETSKVDSINFNLAPAFNIPRLFQLADIQDIIGLVAPKKFTLLFPIDSEGNNLSLGKTNLLSRRGRYAYYRNNVSRYLQIKTGSNAQNASTSGDTIFIKNALLKHIEEN